jgi:hypothetical protein
VKKLFIILILFHDLITLTKDLGMRHCEELRDEAIHMDRHTRLFASFAMTVFSYSVIARNYVTKQSINHWASLGIQWIAALGFSPRSR